MPQWLQHFHMKITPASPSHYMVCTPSWLHGFSPRQCFVPDPLLWTVKGSLCYREQVLINVVLLPTAFKRKKLHLRESFKTPQHSPREDIPSRPQHEAISVTLVRQLYLGKMRTGTIAWHYTDPFCASRGCWTHHTPHFGPYHATVLKISHSGYKQRWPPYTHTRAVCFH